MAYTFQSRATADLIMLADSAKRLLELLGKTPGEPGIFTQEQIPEALATLERVVAEDEIRRKVMEAELRNIDVDETKHAAATSAELGAVSLRQRVAPFADMLRRSVAENKPVTWHL